MLKHINLIIEKTLSLVKESNFLSENDAIISFTLIEVFADIL